jgi:hypothetical protein
MKQNFLFVTVLLCLFLSGKGQTVNQQAGSILFHGIVIDAKSLTPLAGTQVSINKVFSGISSSEGKFAFSVLRGDTIIFSRLGYKGVQMMVSDTLRGIEFLAGIYMSQDTVAIGEIVIVPRIGNLKSDLLKPKADLNIPLENAKSNLAISAYQGRFTQSQLGDPIINYELLRQKQRSDAYTKGQIPPDKMIGISPLLLIPAAYLLMNGLPEKPEMPDPVLSDHEIDQIHKRYLQSKLK